jgi:spore germination protein GerM
MDLIRQGYITPDGSQFDTKAEALDYMRKPQIEAALATITKGDLELAQYLFSNMEEIKEAFEVGTIKRVTKTERNKLKKALEALKETVEPKLAFLRDNAEAVEKSFRWPSVERMNDEEKATKALETLVEAFDKNTALAEWVIEKKTVLLEAFEAGKVKRTVNPKAAAALAEYRAKKAAEKEAAAASA